MRVIEVGHIYGLSNKVDGEQTLKFFKDLPHDSIGHDGVLCQEVLRALINRMLSLWAQQPCDESTEIVKKLRECLILFEARAARCALEKSYAKVGLHIEELPVKDNGHVDIP